VLTLELLQGLGVVYHIALYVDVCNPLVTLGISFGYNMHGDMLCYGLTVANGMAIVTLISTSIYCQSSTSYDTLD